MTRDDQENTSPAALWEAARYFMRWLIAMCGGPCAIVAEVWLSPKERRHIASWLRPVEALVRRLLVVEAVRIARASRAARKHKHKPVRPPAARPRIRKVAFPDPDDSTGWIVRFSPLERPPARPSAAATPDHLLPRVRELGTDAEVLAPARLALSAAQHRERRLESAAERPAFREETPRPKRSRAAGNPWRLAVRIEALTRVLENPAPYARHLARRLRKDPAPIARSCRPPPPRGPGEPRRYGEEPLRLANEHALRALGEFDTS